MSEHTAERSAAHATITEAEFVRLCEDLYTDRRQIYEFNPNAGRREAMLWMLLGCLISLLSIPDTQQPSVNSSSTDPYGDAVREILRHRTHPSFDPQSQLADWSKKIESDDDDDDDDNCDAR